MTQPDNLQPVMSTGPSTPPPPQAPVLSLTSDLNSSLEREKSFPRPSAGASFKQALKTFAWWVLIPMILIGGLAGTIIGCVGYWIVTGSSGMNLVPAGEPSTGMTVGMPSVSIAPGLLTTATISSLLATGISSILFFLLKWKKRAPYDEGSLSMKHDGKSRPGWIAVGVGLLMGVAFYYAYVGVSLLLMKFTGFDMGSSETGMTVDSILRSSVDAHTAGGWTAVVLIILCVAIINPIGEELVFRGMIGRGLVDGGLLRRADGSRSWWATLMVCLLSGLFFGVVHFTGPTWAGILPVILTTLFGALLTWWSSIRTRSLWGSIATHVAFNGVQMILLMITLL